MMKSEDYQKALSLARARGTKKGIISLLQKASEEGDCRADYALAICYFEGKYGIFKNDVLGLKYLKKAAKFDIAEAIYDLAVYYDYNGDESIDIFYLYMRAGLLGHRKACKQISQFYNEGLTVPYNKSLVKEWKRRSLVEESTLSPPWRIPID